MTREEKLIRDIKAVIGTGKFISEHIIYITIKDLIGMYDVEMEINEQIEREISVKRNVG